MLQALSRRRATQKELKEIRRMLGYLGIKPEQQVYTLPIGLVEGKTSACLSKYEDYRIAV